MGLLLCIEGAPPAACRSFRHHVHAEVTRAPRQVTRGAADADPRVAGRSRHEPFAVTRELDHLSPRLLAACSAGERLARVTLVLSRPAVAHGEEALAADAPWFRIELTDVIVTSVLTSLEDDGPLETVALDYAAVRWVHEGGDHASEASWSVHGSGT